MEDVVQRMVGSNHLEDFVLLFPQRLRLAPLLDFRVHPAGHAIQFPGHRFVLLHGFLELAVTLLHLTFERKGRLKKPEIGALVLHAAFDTIHEHFHDPVQAGDFRHNRLVTHFIRLSRGHGAHSPGWPIASAVKV